MNKKSSFLSLLLFIACTAWSTAQAAETGTLNEQLELFRPFLGKTWRGEFKDSTPEKPVFDVARWERALNGQAIRVLHSVNDGVYGGESLMFWDAEKKELRYHYFTTAGFQTTGSLTFKDKRFTAVEKVKGSANGIEEVRSTTELKPDGTMVTKAEYFKDGKVVGGREVIYKEDPKAEVKFK